MIEWRKRTEAKTSATVNSDLPPLSYTPTSSVNTSAASTPKATANQQSPPPQYVHKTHTNGSQVATSNSMMPPSRGITPQRKQRVIQFRLAWAHASAAFETSSSLWPTYPTETYPPTSPWYHSLPPQQPQYNGHFLRPEQSLSPPQIQAQTVSRADEGNQGHFYPSRDNPSGRDGEGATAFTEEMPSGAVQNTARMAPHKVVLDSPRIRSTGNKSDRHLQKQFVWQNYVQPEVDISKIDPRLFEDYDTTK